MGNYISCKMKEEDDNCIICRNKLDKCKLSKCITCSQIIHGSCEEKYRKTTGYSKCPNCQRIGTMSTYSSVICAT